MLAPVHNPRLLSIGWVRSLESDVTGATGRSAAVGDAATVGPDAGGWATRRAERNPCAVGPLPFRRPRRVIRRGDGAWEIDAPIEVRRVRCRHHGVIPDHVAKHGRVCGYPTGVIPRPSSVAVTPVQRVVAAPHRLCDVHVGHVEPSVVGPSIAIRASHSHLNNSVLGQSQRSRGRDTGSRVTYRHVPRAIQIAQWSRRCGGRRWWWWWWRRRWWWRWRWREGRLVAVGKPALSAISGWLARTAPWWCWTARAGPTLAVAGAGVSFPSSTLAEWLVPYGRAERHPRWTGCRWRWRRGHAGADGPFSEPGCTGYVRMTVAEEEPPAATTCPHGVIAVEAAEPSP